MTSVKNFHSAMPGAPVLSGTAGTLLAVLDACLVTGFGLKTADSLTVAGGVATVAFSTGHSFQPGTIALIEGATPAGLSGEKRILSTAANSVTFAAPGIADGTATGTISAKLAPAGWEKAFSGTNVAAYRPSDVTSTRMFLRVDDTGTTNARVVGYEAMTDVSTGTGRFPSSAQISGGGWWPKANAASATAGAWTVVADSKSIILHVHTHTSSLGASGVLWEFGDFASLKSGDAYACRLQCHSMDVASGTSALSTMTGYCGISGADAGAYLARSFTALGGSVAGAHAADGLFSGARVSGASAGSAITPSYPNGPDNGLLLTRKSVIEPGVCLRGRSRGVYVAPQACHQVFNWRDKVAGQGDLLGRQLLAIKCGSPAGTASEGVVFVDITGPWG